MPNEPLNNLTKEDVVNAANFVGTALFTILKDDVSDDKKKEILTSIYGLYLADSPSEDSAIIYNGKYSDFCEEAQKFRLYSDANRPKSSWSDDFSRRVFTNPTAKEPLRDFTNSLNEVASLLDQKLKNNRNLKKNEADFIYVLKSIIGGLGRGESLSDQLEKNPQLTYASNLMAKLYLTGGSLSVSGKDSKVKMEKTLENNDDKKVIENLRETGILQAMSGACKVSEMQKNYVQKGNVTKKELIAEFSEQEKRLDKSLDFSEELYNELNTGNQLTFANDYGEICGGKRGYSFVKNDADICKKILEAGFLVEDLPALRKVARYIHELQANADKTESQIEKCQSKIDEENAKEKPDQAVIKNYSEEINKISSAASPYKEALETLQEPFENITDFHGNLTEEKRLELLNNLKAATEEVIKKTATEMDDSKTKLPADSGIKTANWELENRLNTPLKTYEKAELAGNARELYEQLDAVDPIRVSSSKEFADFKNKLKALRNYERRNYVNGVSEDASDGEYQDLAIAAAKAAAKYLRYKTRQMDGPKRGHKRSELEAARVRVAEAILDRLNTLNIAGLNGADSMIPQNGKVEGVRRPFVEKKVKNIEEGRIEENTEIRYPDTEKPSDIGVDELPHNISNYIKLHTGKGAINGTEEEMREDFFKVAAAFLWYKKNPNAEFNIDEIHKMTDTAKEFYKFINLNEEKLVKILSTGNSVDNCLKKYEKEMWTPGNLFEDITYKDGQTESRFAAYVSCARYTYRFIPDPKGKSEEYRELFKTVKEMAHMKMHLDEVLDHRLLEDRLKQLNVKAMQLCTEILNKTKGKGLEGKGALHVMASIEHTANEKGQNYVKHTVERLNQLNNITNINDSGLISLKNYGAVAINKGLNSRTLSYVRPMDIKYASGLNRGILMSFEERKMDGTSIKRGIKVCKNWMPRLSDKERPKPRKNEMMRPKISYSLENDNPVAHERHEIKYKNGYKPQDPPKNNEGGPILGGEPEKGNGPKLGGG